MTKIIELRPDKRLINDNFEKYQYSSDIVAIDLERKLTRDVYRQEPGNTQDSWLEARIFAFHNHLFENPYDSSCWYVDENRDVWRLDHDDNLTLVRNLPTDKITTYNPSIAFASIDTIVLTNGDDTLHFLIDNSSQEGKVFRIDAITPGVILDSRYIEEKSKIIVAMCGISEIEGKKRSRLSIRTYEYNASTTESERSLKFAGEQIINFKGPVEYVYIEESGDYVHTISQDTAIFEEDSSKKEQETSKESRIGEEIKIPKYCWSQDEDSLTVWIKTATKCDKSKVKIDVSANVLSITVDGNIAIQGDSQHRLDADLTTWSLEGETIKLELAKHESGLMWNELIRGDTGGECLPNETLAAEIHARLSHLCCTSEQTSNIGDSQPVVGFNSDQLEECDLQGPDNYLQRMNLIDRTVTHLGMLGTTNHVLFTQKLRDHQEFCLRHDHHGCVWQARVNGDSWEIQHVETFPGFGYVEASKSNKKFCISPPNRSYVAIVEHTRQAFIYEKPSRSRSIAKQRIVDIGSETSPIMGAVATNKNLTFLTTDKLYRLTINP